jgi:hypothetical protein
MNIARVEAETNLLQMKLVALLNAEMEGARIDEETVRQLIAEYDSHIAVLRKTCFSNLQ